MARPRLLGGGISNFDTQRVYEEIGQPLGTVGFVDGGSYVWCSRTGTETLAVSSVLVVNQEPVFGVGLSLDSLAASTEALNVGMTSITGITSAVAIRANAFAEGELFVGLGGGRGTGYRIRDHSAFTASTADGSIELYDPIEVASNASTTITLVKNKYADPIRSLGFGRQRFVGVNRVIVPFGSVTPRYFWAQRNGHCVVTVTGTPPQVGTPMVIASDSRGNLVGHRETVEVSESRDGGGRTVHVLDKTQVVGELVAQSSDDTYQIIDLQNSIF